MPEGEKRYVTTLITAAKETTCDTARKFWWPALLRLVSDISFRRDRKVDTPVVSTYAAVRAKRSRELCRFTLARAVIHEPGKGGGGKGGGTSLFGL